MPRFLFALLLALTACEKREHRAASPIPGNLSVLNMTGVVSRGSLVPAIVIMGQSNGYRMFFYGDVAMRVTGAKYAPDATYINCAASGTGLYQQLPGSQIYNACLAQIAAAHAHPIAYIWWQGENEAEGGRSIVDVQSWTMNFRTIMRALETATKSQGAPIGLARIAPIMPTNEPYINDIRDQQVSLGGDVHTVNIDDLPWNVPEDLHYPSESYNAAAERLITAAFN